MGKYKLKQSETVEAIQLVDDFGAYGKEGDWLVIHGKQQSVMMDDLFKAKYEPVSVIQAHPGLLQDYPQVDWTKYHSIC